MMDRQGNTKFDIIKADGIVDDIYRIWKETPSPYTYPKSVLAEARGYTRSDLKQTIKLLEKARESFVAESVLAVRYNQYADKIEKSGGNSRSYNSEYIRTLASGDFKHAEEHLERLISSLIPPTSENFTLTVASAGAGSTVVRFNNRSSFMVSVEAVTAAYGGGPVEFKPKAPFPVYPNSSADITVSAPTDGLDVSLVFRDSHGNKTITLEGVQ